MLTKTKWLINSSRSTINFEIEHFIIPNIKGEFKIFKAAIYCSDNSFMIEEISLWISATSINTGNVYCDEHLKSADILDVENYKHLTFKGIIPEKLNFRKSFDLEGYLTIKGITKKIKLAVEFRGIRKNIFGKERANFTIKGIINRNDWGLILSSDLDAWKILASDNVKISCEIQLEKSTLQDYQMPLDIVMEQTASATPF